MLSPDADAVLCRSCGGVPRDLLQLARVSLQEAWIRGADRAEASDAVVAADRLGRDLLLGLTEAELLLLKRVHVSGLFVPVTDEQRALIPTKRILEIRLANGLPQHRVHPTIVPLLDGVAPA